MRLFYYLAIVAIICVLFWNGGMFNIVIAWAIGLGAEPMLRKIERSTINDVLDRLEQRVKSEDPQLL